MANKCTEHAMFRNMKATFSRNHETIAYPAIFIAKCTEHTRSINMDATLRGNPETIAYPC